jgi:hypothetical protein
LSVRGDQGDAFDRGLGDEQAVDWVFVEQGKHLHGDRVVAGDREFDIAVFDQISAKDRRVEEKVFAPKSALDGDLPDAERAEVEIVLGVSQKGESSLGESLGMIGRPEEDMRIGEDPHGSP